MYQWQVVEYPERSSLGGDNKLPVSLLFFYISDWHDGQVQLERLPMLAIVKRYVHPGFSSGIQQSALVWILANDPGESRLRNTCLLYTSDAADERSSVDLGGR